MAQPATARPRPSLLTMIAIAILALIIIVGLAVLIIWLVLRPRALVYSVEEAEINGYDMKNNHLNATFHLILRSYNPNTRVSVHYDYIEVSVSSEEQTIASDHISPFYQARRSVVRLETKPQARSTPLSSSVSKDLRVQRSTGQVELDVRLKAKVRFKVGSWKSRRRTLKVFCSPVMVHNSSKKFQRTHCDVDI